MPAALAILLASASSLTGAVALTPAGDAGRKSRALRLPGEAPLPATPPGALLLQQGRSDPGAVVRHEQSAGTVFFVAFLFACFLFGLMVHEHWRWKTFDKDDGSGLGDTFSNYLHYRFCEWFTTYNLAPAVVLLSLTLMLVVIGAVLYALLVGGSPAHAMFKVFIWTSMAAADAEDTVGGRFLGIVMTVCGLIVLSLLLGIVAEAFAARMADIKRGYVDVREGGHMVILGYSPGTKRLLEELAMAADSEGGNVMVVLAARKSKVEVETELAKQGTQMLKSKLIVRSGEPSSFADLRRVAADKASTVLVVADSSVPPYDRHKKLVCTLLALRSKGWPRKGNIVVQCCPEMNSEMIRSIYPDKVEVVVVGEIVSKLMVQSTLEHGVAGVFETILGFEGDEIYSKKWPELVGSTFRDVYFRIPEATVMGVFDGQGRCNLNPGWNYTLDKDDSIIVLAEDDNTYGPKRKCYYDYKAHRVSDAGAPTKSSAKEEIEDPRVLIVGWSQLIGSLLAGLDSRTRSAEQVHVTIYSDRPVPEREAEINMVKARDGLNLESMVITHVAVSSIDMTSRECIERLEHWKCNGIYILATSDSEQGTDETNVTLLVQMQDIGRSHESKYKFDPVVEICMESTKEHLKVLGLTNVIYSSALVSKAMAAVAYNPSVNAIYNEFSLAIRNEFDIAPLQEFLPEAETVPRQVNFGQVAHLISQSSRTVLLGWSMQNDQGEVEWILNPKNKRESRAWTDDDRVCVIKHIDASVASLKVSIPKGFHITPRTF